MIMKTILSALVALSVIAGVAGSANALDAKTFFEQLDRDHNEANIGITTRRPASVGGPARFCAPGAHGRGGLNSETNGCRCAHMRWPVAGSHRSRIKQGSLVTPRIPTGP